MHNIPDFLRVTPEMQEHFAKGGMIKRADGSYSRRGLWDNIRANRGSGRKPTKEMLEQEKKIKNSYATGGPFLLGMNPLSPTVYMTPKQLRNTTEIALDAASFVPGLAPYAYVAGLPFTFYDVYEDVSMNKPWYKTTADAAGVVPGMKYTKYIPGSGLNKAARVVKELTAFNNAANVFNIVNDINDAYNDSDLPPGKMLPQVRITPRESVNDKPNLSRREIEQERRRQEQQALQDRINSRTYENIEKVPMNIPMRDVPNIATSIPTSLIKPVPSIPTSPSYLEQEAKIRDQEQYGGLVDEYGNGGYTVRRSNARKGKTHVVIGPDGTKKYFGDPNMGERSKSKHGKEAFYARHAKNLKNNPYFRAYARATWKDGGEIPTYASGTSSVDPSQLSQDQLTNWNRFQYYASKNANITDPAYNTNRQMGYDLLNQYNQANPNNQIAADSIPTYQAYFQKLQAGQTNVGQAGQDYVQKNFTQGVSPQDAFIGTQTLGSRVPMRGKKTVTNANTGQVVYNSGPRTSTALPTPTPSQPVAQTNTAPVPGMQTATLAYGGYYKDGGNYGAFYGRRDAAKMQRMFTPSADSMTPNFFANGGLTKYQTKGFVDEPTTGNSGQGVNTTTPAASPAVASTPQNGMIGPPQPNWKDSSPNLDNYTMKGPQDLPASSNPASTSDIIANNQQYEDMMIKNYGVTRSEIDKRYAELSDRYKNAQSSDIYTALNKELADQAKVNEQEKARKGEQARIKSIAGTMKGASQAIDAAFAGLDLLSQMAPNSNANAVRSQEIKNAAMNSKNIVGNRKGIEYAAYGGYAGLKEGIELDLTTQQIHELEKQGYKFQIL